MRGASIPSGKDVTWTSGVAEGLFESKTHLGLRNGNDAYRTRKGNPVPCGHRRHMKRALAPDVGETKDSSPCWRHQKPNLCARERCEGPWENSDYLKRGGWERAEKHTSVQRDDLNVGVRLPTLACIKFQMLVLAWKFVGIRGPLWSGSRPTEQPRQCLMFSYRPLCPSSLVWD